MANRIEEIPEEEFEETKAKFKSKNSRIISSSEDIILKYMINNT